MKIKVDLANDFKKFSKTVGKDLVKSDVKAYDEAIRKVNEKYKPIIRSEYVNAFKTSSKPSKFGPSLPKNYSKFANTFQGKVFKTNKGPDTYDFLAMYSKLKYYDVFYEGATIMAKGKYMVIPVSDKPMSKSKKAGFNAYLTTLVNTKQAYIKKLPNGNKAIMAKIATSGIASPKRVLKSRYLTKPDGKVKRLDRKKFKYVAVAFLVLKTTIFKKYNFRDKYTKKIKQDIVDLHKKLLTESKVFQKGGAGNYIQVR